MQNNLLLAYSRPADATQKSDVKRYVVRADQLAVYTKKEALGLSEELAAAWAKIDRTVRLCLSLLRYTWSHNSSPRCRA